MSAPFERPGAEQRGLSALLSGLMGNPAAAPEVLVRLTAASVDRTGPARRRDLPV
ncbi:hypothetical protein ACFW2Y_28030 [Streptomyces sp. NPDC058877]|uniref:hypothetical protein n=1 Tax=unclassified Streptomyces TaxID=2593676 RepID=UPI0036B89F9E